MASIDRSALSGLIPEPVTREIMQGAIAESAVLRMGRRLANMSSKTQTINVLDALPSAYFVNGEATDSGAEQGAFKQTTKMAWDKKKLYAEEIAVIVPIPEAALDDSDYDIWGEVKPRLTEAFGKVIDAAILFGTNKPSTWRAGVVPSAIAAGNGVPIGTSVFDDIMGESGLIAKVELDGFNPNGVMSAIQMRGKLRGLKDTTGQPIFKSDMQGATRYGLDGMDMYFPMNGAFDPAQAQMIVGDWSQLVYAIRQDMTFKIFTEGVIQDPSTKAITYNLMQNDMVALRAVMRLGWEIANPINAYNADIENPFPFSVYGKSGTVSTVTVKPSTATVKKGGTQAFTAAVAGEGIISDDVEWSQTGGTKSSISENGVLTVGSGETGSSITVTAKSKQDNAKTGSATVTVQS
jgi:HK97 family phage major capsid protein